MISQPIMDASLRWHDNMARLMLAVLIGVAIGAMPGLAHHSAVEFDFTKREYLQGSVKELRVINPHMAMTLVVKDANGEREIKFEGHSVNNFYRSGWRDGLVKVGDKITVRFVPRKDKKDGGFLDGFTTVSGKIVVFKTPGFEFKVP